jgi:hypothetical protein
MSSTLVKTGSVEVSAQAGKEFKKATKVGYILLTRNGKPIAYVLPTAYYDEEDIGYMTDPEFWKAIQKLRQEDGGVPWEQLKAELDERDRQEAADRRRKQNVRKRKAS